MGNFRKRCSIKCTVQVFVVMKNTLLFFEGAEDWPLYRIIRGLFKPFSAAPENKPPDVWNALYRHSIFSDIVLYTPAYSKDVVRSFVNSLLAELFTVGASEECRSRFISVIISTLVWFYCLWVERIMFPNASQCLASLNPIMKQNALCFNAGNNLTFRFLLEGLTATREKASPLIFSFMLGRKKPHAFKWDYKLMLVT